MFVLGREMDEKSYGRAMIRSGVFRQKAFFFSEKKKTLIIAACFLKTARLVQQESIFIGD